MLRAGLCKYSQAAVSLGGMHACCKELVGLKFILGLGAPISKHLAKGAPFFLTIHS